MPKNTDIEPTTTTTPAQATEAPSVPRRGLSALAIIGISVGGLLLAGTLFGGGVAVGTQLSSSQAPSAMSQMQSDQRGPGQTGTQDGTGGQQGGPGQQGGQGGTQQDSQNGTDTAPEVTPGT